MQVIPNKYLRTNGNRINNGPSSMLKANNVVFDNGKIMSRLGQQLLFPEDPVGQAFDPGGYQTIVPVKIFYYNNRVWGYFRNSSNYDLIGYFDNTIGVFGRWLCSQVPSGWYSAESLSPQFASSNKRLFFSSNQGIYSSPTLDNAQDEILTSLSTYQTTLRRTGCPQALPFQGLGLIDTTAIPPLYNSNFLPVGARVAYRHVWKYTDANGTVVYGAVSDRYQIQNTDAASRATFIDIFVPLQIVDGSAQASRFAVEIYRSQTSKINAAGFAPSPSDEMYLVSQLRLTDADIISGSLPFTDIIPDDILQAPLYTNQTEQGLAASRIRPPMSGDICSYAGSMWYSNVTQRWSLPFQLSSVVDAGGGSQKGLANNDIIVIGQRCFQAKDVPLGPLVGPQQNQFQIFTTAGLANSFNRIRETTRSLAYQFNDKRDRPYYNLQTNSGPDDLAGKFVLEQRTDGLVPSGVKPYIGLYRAGGWTGAGSSNPSPIIPAPIIGSDATAGVIGQGFRIVRISASGPGFIDFTLNASPDFIVGDTINIARLNTYQDMALAVGSQGDGVVNILPGQYKVRSIAGTVVTIQGLTTSGAFNQQVGVAPFATLWTHLGVMHCVYSTALQLESPAIGVQKKTKNRTMFSAFQEPENAPALNYIDIGSSDKKIVKCINLGQSMFVFKQDGLYRITGSYPQFNLQLFDPNIFLSSQQAVATMGGRIYAMTKYGVFEISQSNSKRISYDIQNQLDFLSSGYRKIFAVGNQADHSVYFWFCQGDTFPLTNGQFLCYVYDGVGWSTRDDDAISACSGYDYSVDRYTMFTMKSKGSAWLTRQKRSFNGSDYCDESIDLTIADITIEGPTTVVVDFSGLTMTPLIFQQQWVTVGSCVLAGDFQLEKRAYVTAVNSGYGPSSIRLDLQFLDPNVTTADWDTNPLRQFNVLLAYTRQWQYGINAEDDVSSRKHFSEVGLVFQQPYFSVADIGFSSDIAPRTQYLISNIKGFATITGYNFVDWPLMLDDYDLAQKTIRALVSRDHAYCSQLRVSFRHNRACQFISCYGYFIRSSAGGKNIQRNNQNG